MTTEIILEQEPDHEFEHEDGNARILSRFRKRPGGYELPLAPPGMAEMIAAKIKETHPEMCRGHGTIHYVGEGDAIHFQLWSDDAEARGGDDA